MKYGQYFYRVLSESRLKSDYNGRDSLQNRSRNNLVPFASSDETIRLPLLRDVPEKYLFSVTLYLLQPIPKFVRPTIRFSLWLDLHDAQNRSTGAPNRNYLP